MNFKLKKFRGLLVASALVLTQMSAFSAAQAQVNTLGIEFAASAPNSYSHETGGGFWNLGRENTDIKKSLESGDFKCNDVVTYLTKITAPNNSDLQSLGMMTLDLNYSISMDTTGASGVALGEPVVAVFNTGDPANAGLTPAKINSTASVIDSSTTGAMFTKGAELLKKVRVTGVEAGDTIIVRMDTKIYCKSGTSPTGNLQVKFVDGSLVFKNGTTPVSPAEPLKIGTQTISLKNVQDFAIPSITLVKTVTTPDKSCPGGLTLTIEPMDQVRYCYALTNDSSSPTQIVGPLYNVTNIFDDNDQYPDFQVTLTSGLTDVDKDGQIDDLAPGATAYGTYVTAFDGDKDSTVTNVATVSGNGQPNGSGITYTATDSITVIIDAPAPDITIVKLTNGSDGSTILVGTPITWTYLVTNTGDRALKDVYVTDSKSVSVSCPSTDLAKGASMTCTATGTAVAGNYSNTGTVFGTFGSTTVSASDESSYFGANPLIDIQKTPDTQTVVENLKATFSITVTNIGNVDLTGVEVTDPLSTGCAKSIGALAVGAYSTYTCESPAITGNLTNVATVVGYYGTTQVTDNDSANVVIDYLPNIEVTKSADPKEVDETGANVTYTFSVKNKAPEDFILTSLVDDKFGDMSTNGSTCTLPHTIAAGDTYSCTLVKFMASDSLTAHKNVITAQGHDPEGNPGSGSDDETVTFKDVLPTIKVTKTVNPTIIKSTGDWVDYTITIFNTGPEAVTLNSLVDPAISLPASCTSLVTQVIPISGSIQCVAHVFMNIGVETTFTNTVTAIANDNENNNVSASASAVLKSFWYGRTPGFWKNHPDSWKSGYLTTDKVKDIFSIPDSFLIGTYPNKILDLDKNGSNDTLIAGLAYKGGNDLAGGAQILLRAAIAALLNKAYYGADYPAEVSTSALITNVNTVLAAKDRAQYITLANIYDKWNNGVEGPLP